MKNDIYLTANKVLNTMGIEVASHRSEMQILNINDRILSAAGRGQRFQLISTFGMSEGDYSSLITHYRQCGYTVNFALDHSSVTIGW